MSKFKNIVIPTIEEDEIINAGINADQDTYELSKDEFKQLRRVGRPKSQSPKIQLTVRYDADIVASFKQYGPGWQTRMNNALRDWLKTNKTV